MCLNNEYITEKRLDDIDDTVRQDEHDGEIIYYFRPKCYRPSSVALMDVINGLIFANNCSGGAIVRLLATRLLKRLKIQIRNFNGSARGHLLLFFALVVLLLWMEAKK